MQQDRIILPITPQTWFKSLPQHKWFFIIPEDCRKLKGKKPCVKYRRTGTCPHVLGEAGLKIKRRIERYNQYKIDVKTLASQMGFKMPAYGWSLYFYLPIPLRWKDNVRSRMNGQPKHSKPDIDNFEKAFYDSLSITDERVAQLSGHGKFWVDTMTRDAEGKKVIGPGWIEILLNQPVYNPYNVQFFDQELFKAQPKRKWVKKEGTIDRRRTRHQKPQPIKLDQKALFKLENKLK